MPQVVFDSVPVALVPTCKEHASATVIVTAEAAIETIPPALDASSVARQIENSWKPETILC